jgi:hypothetical protein
MRNRKQLVEDDRCKCGEIAIVSKTVDGMRYHFCANHLGTPVQSEEDEVMSAVMEFINRPKITPTTQPMLGAPTDDGGRKRWI